MHKFILYYFVNNNVVNLQYTMSKKDLNFKRGISQISTGIGGVSTISNGHADLNHKKKTGKLRQGADYMMARGQVPGVLTLNNNLDITSENVAGGMSVKDIELRMSEEEEFPETQQQSPRSKEQASMATPSLSSSESAEDVFRNTRRLSLKSPPKKCSDRFCNWCAWHVCVLKNPHKVQWMAKTVRVELRRQRNCSWPGFDHKLMHHKKKNGEIDSYYIVTAITCDGIASESGLCVGDLILSVNSIPLQSGKENSMKFGSCDTLVFQIQHPEALSPMLLDRQSSSTHSWAHSSEMDRNLQQPPSPSPSPPDITTKSPHEKIPMPTIKKPTPTDFQPLSQATIFVCGNSATEFVNCFVGDRLNNFVQPNTCAFCFDLSLKSIPGSAFSSSSCVTIDNWESLSHLFSENKERALKTPSSSLLSCINVRLVVVEDDNFFFTCCPWMYSSSSAFILTFDTQRLLASSEVEMSRLTRIAGAVRTGMLKHLRANSGGAFSQGIPRPGTPISSHPYLMVVGIETSQDFNLEEIRTPFYTSLGEALPKPDIIPVRQGHMSAQMSSLRERIFLVLSGCPLESDCPSPSNPSTAMFPNGLRAANAHLTAGNVPSLDDLLQGSQLRMSYPTAFALDIISNLRLLTISQRELLKTLQEDSPDSVFKDSPAATKGMPSSSPRYVIGSKHGPLHQESVFAQVVEDLRNSRNLILLDSVNMGCWVEGDKEFVLPTILFDKILRLAQRVVAGDLTEAQQNILMMLGACGIVSRPEMTELLKLVSSQPEKLLLCLDDLQMTFPVRSCQHDTQQELDSGFDDGLNVMCPYFKEDVPFDPTTLIGFDELWTLRFSEEVPLSSFYCILSDLSVRWLQGLSLSLYSHLVASVTQVLTGSVVYYVCFQQERNQIQAFRRRAGSHGSMPLNKENQMTEQLACHTVKEIARKHVSVSTQVLEIHVGPPPSEPVSSPSRLCPERYQGDLEIDLPEEFLVEDTAGEPDVAGSPEYEAHRDMLRSRVTRLSYVHPELNEIYRFISVDGAWRELAGHLGLSSFDTKVCNSKFETRPSILPGQQFLEDFMSENCTTVGQLLKALLQMGTYVYREMAGKLWTAALLNNSRYYLDLRSRGKID